MRVPTIGTSFQYLKAGELVRQAWDTPSWPADEPIRMSLLQLKVNVYSRAFERSNELSRLRVPFYRAVLRYASWRGIRQLLWSGHNP
jgi:hypothetical protein